MIGCLTGILIKSGLTEILIDVNGVGYEVIIPLSTFDNLPREGEKVSLLTFLSIREDAHVLFGFATHEEKNLFKLLNTVNGIGPKLSMKILSSISVKSFCEFVSSSNVKALSRINGVGPKSAERIVIELKDKVANIVPEVIFGGGVINANKELEEAVMALVQLGFKYELAKKAAAKAASGLSEKEQNSENIIRATLQSIN